MPLGFSCADVSIMLCSLSFFMCVAVEIKESLFFLPFPLLVLW